MKISVLLNREPFDKIFEKTMESFLSDHLNKSHVVFWENKKIVINKERKYPQKWICNSLVNSIFVRGANNEIFNSINGEYKTNTMKPWKSKFQRLYLFLSQNKITAPIFSDHSIFIYPPLKNPKNKLIIGGNNKIRLIDLVENKVYVILKNGFERKYIERELFVRENFKFLDIPKIIEKGDNGNWFSEQYVTGKSPNRLDSEKGLIALNKVINGIHKMLINNKEIQSFNKYISKLKKNILNGIKQINYLHFNEKNEIIDFVDSISNELNKYSNNKLITSFCHGDFHLGNILCDGKKNWILDWENSGKKQIGYDLLVLLMDSRISNGYNSRFSKLLNDEFEPYQRSMINNWPEINWNDKYSKKSSLLLFLIEELDFYINENANPIFFNNSKKLIGRVGEIRKCFNSAILI